MVALMLVSLILPLNLLRLINRWEVQRISYGLGYRKAVQSSEESEESELEEEEIKPEEVSNQKQSVVDFHLRMMMLNIDQIHQRIVYLIQLSSDILRICEEECRDAGIKSLVIEKRI